MHYASVRIVYSLILGASLINASCGRKKDTEQENPPTSQAPSVPASGTLAVNMDSLSGTALTTASGVNHLAAAAVTVIVNVAVGAQLAVPAAALKAALSQTPTYQASDESWNWALDFTANSISWKAVLNGKAGSSGASTWTLTVTKSPTDSNGCCSSFTWLTGNIISSQSGTWTMNDPTTPTTPSPHRQISYTYTSDNQRDLTITVKKAAGEWKEGGTIRYIVAADQITTTLIKDPALATKKTEIIWNSSTKAGSLENEKGEKVCWNANLQNTACT